MTQISPVQIPQYQSQEQPNYNAVKIDINNPQVNAGKTPAQGQGQATNPMYAYPKSPIYEVPKQSIYAPQQPQTTGKPDAATSAPAPAVPAPVLVKPTVETNGTAADAKTDAPAPEAKKDAPATPAPEATTAAPKKVEVKAPQANTPRPGN